jgi:hypothetical protein
MKAKIRLDTMKDITQFVNICSKVSSPVHITDGGGLKVSAKSVLGVMYSMEFSEIWCECDEDIYNQIEHFTIID